MANSYSPGLSVSENWTIEKDRRLPVSGKVHAEAGSSVQAEEVVASAEMPGKIFPVHLAGGLGCHPKEVVNFLLTKPGAEVKKGECIAETPGILGFFKNRIESPLDGHMESVSELTGQAILREDPTSIQLQAFVQGKVEEIFPNEGAKIRGRGAFIQGIFGIGPEAIGPLKIIPASSSDVPDESQISPQLKGSILIICGSLPFSTLLKAREAGVKGIITGSCHASALEKFFGKSFASPLTGTEDKGLTLILTEGFGAIPMATRTFELLKKFEGKKAAMNGATQLRSGVIRPEIFIPLETLSETVSEAHGPQGLTIGSLVRIIRAPFFGKLGKVTGIPADPRTFDSEICEKAVEIQLSEIPERVFIPRSNLEVLET